MAGILYEAAVTRRAVKVEENEITTKFTSAAEENGQDDELEREIARPSWLDRASSRFGGSYSAGLVRSVKYVARISPFLLVMIPYWGIYGQTKTAFQIQGCQMNVSLGSFQLPVSAMNIFNNVAILILVPVFEKYLYPYLKNKGREPTMLQKIGVGFLFATAAMVAAGILEIVRLQQVPAAGNYYDENARDNISPCHDIDDYNPYQYQAWYEGESDDKPTNCYQTCPASANGTLSLECIECDDIPQMSDMSMLWQMPLFVLVGVSEIFASITSLEFFYSQAPCEMRSVSQACNLLTSALGSWLTIPLTILVNVNQDDEWIPSDLNDGHLDLYFFLLALLMIMGFLVFVRISRGYAYISVDHFETPAVEINEDENGLSEGLTKMDQGGDEQDSEIRSPLRHRAS